MCAKRANRGHDAPLPPTVSASDGAALIRRQVAKAKEYLAKRPISVADEKAWNSVTQDYLAKAFGVGAHQIGDVMNIGIYAFAFGGGTEQQYEEQRAKDFGERITVLEALADSLEHGATEKGAMDVNHSNDVFIIHGHDTAMKSECARLVDNLGLKAVILHEQANAGRTIIEKFMGHADCGFAVAILTSDDVGGRNVDELNPRARQNVIFELGFVIGRLGRGKTCALYEKGVELPSDYQGVGYVAIDDRGAWKFELAKEMKAAGLPVDLNKVS